MQKTVKYDGSKIVSCRLPADLFEALRVSARMATRSFSGEVVHRLRKTVDDEAAK